MTTFIVGFSYCLFFISVKILFLNRFKLIFGFIRNCSVRRRHSCRWTKSWRLSLPKSKKSRILTCGCACILIKVSKSALLVCVCVYIYKFPRPPSIRPSICCPFTLFIYISPSRRCINSVVLKFSTANLPKVCKLRAGCT